MRIIQRTRFKCRIAAFSKEDAPKNSNGPSGLDTEI